jgi:hypothetical protein
VYDFKNNFLQEKEVETTKVKGKRRKTSRRTKAETIIRM